MPDFYIFSWPLTSSVTLGKLTSPVSCLIWGKYLIHGVTGT